MKRLSGPFSNSDFKRGESGNDPEEAHCGASLRPSDNYNVTLDDMSTKPPNDPDGAYYGASLRPSDNHNVTLDDMSTKPPNDPDEARDDASPKLAIDPDGAVGDVSAKLPNNASGACVEASPMSPNHIDSTIGNASLKTSNDPNREYVDASLKSPNDPDDTIGNASPKTNASNKCDSSPVPEDIQGDASPKTNASNKCDSSPVPEDIQGDASPKTSRSRKRDSLSDPKDTKDKASSKPESSRKRDSSSDPKGAKAKASSKSAISNGIDSSSDHEDSLAKSKPMFRHMEKRRMPFDPFDMEFDYFYFYPYMDPFSYRYNRRGRRRDYCSSYNDSFQNNRPPSPPKPKPLSPQYQAIVDWIEPEMVEPTIQKESSSVSKHHGLVSTDAKLYLLKEKREDDSEFYHSVLRLPSILPNHTKQSNTLNILMADVSFSMYYIWTSIMEHWNNIVAPKLEGKTKIYTFDSKVHFRREGTKLEESDFSKGSTELTGALQTVVDEAYQCKEKYVNVFIITDGGHNGSPRKPRTVIACMRFPKGKVCNVYLIGVGNQFPVQYSIDIRSRLHSGSTNFPALFWIKTKDGVREEMENIGKILSGGSSHQVKLNIPGTPLPGLPLKNDFYLEELVYFQQKMVKDEEVELTSGKDIYQLKLESQKIPMDTLLELFRQWNTAIIQRSRKKENIPDDIIPLMERLFKTYKTRPLDAGGPSLSERLRWKEKKKENMDFRQFIKAIKSILTEGKYMYEIHLAEDILTTSVRRTKKVEEKALQLKGHTDAEYGKDFDEFARILEENREGIKCLPKEPEHCCSATRQSTLADLQDEEGFNSLKYMNKFEFLKTFTISGIPVFAPTRNSVAMNPWSYGVQKILDPPYATLSQIALETLPEDPDDEYDYNKKKLVKQNSIIIGFNAIIPVFSPESASVLQPLVRTRLYAMCATFSIMKNPHIIDFNIHMAALGVTWVRCLYEHPSIPRSEFVRNRMLSIEATAACYMDRPGYAKYTRILIENTPQALMTESTEIFDGQTIKCETIVKPMFILYMIERCGNTLDVLTKYNIMKLILLEYIGRCISHYRPGEKFETKKDHGENTRAPYSDFFASSFEDQHKKIRWLQKYVDEVKPEMKGSGRCLLESYYTLEKVRKKAEIVAKTKVEAMKNDMTAKFTVKVNMERAIQLRDVTLSGDLSWATLKIFAREVGLPENAINELFGEENMFLYVGHALSYKSSRDRLSTDNLSSNVLDLKSLKTHILAVVQKENLTALSKDLYDSLVSMIEEAWLNEYLDVHKEVVEPMSIHQIVYKAQGRGIDVTEETFSTIYKRYRPKVGLLGNACQTKACPYYLIPDKTYNQHASVERIKAKEPFIHALHLTSHRDCEKDLPFIIRNISSGINRKPVQSIPTEEVEKWCSDVRKLKNIYSENLNASKKEEMEWELS